MSTARFALLSNRERQVLQLIAQDLTDREIARRLAIGERTIRAHTSRIFLKLGVASRVGAAVLFTEWAICQMSDPPGWKNQWRRPARAARVTEAGSVLGVRSRPRAPYQRRVSAGFGRYQRDRRWSAA
jgi:DNA-binding CsgD family transcriptional regulator